MTRYVGRFAPSPTGPLHAGSLVAALASWLDARAHLGVWHVRMEDTDTPRCVPGADDVILQQLAACGLQPDDHVVYQSQRGSAYTQALAQLHASQRVYACQCSRRDIAQALHAQGQVHERHAETVYPGTCRNLALGSATAETAWGTHAPTHHAPALSRPLAWRLRVSAGEVHWQDRRLGPQQQDVAAAVGDFVLRRADGLWAYQLAVVVDDAWQGVTHVVRGEDLCDNVARQIVLQEALGLPRPRYLHTPLVRDAQGDKLSKQTGAVAVAVNTAPAVLAALQAAAGVLGLPPTAHTVPAEALAYWVAAWADAVRAQQNT